MHTDRMRAGHNKIHIRTFSLYVAVEAGSSRHIRTVAFFPPEFFAAPRVWLAYGKRLRKTAVG